METQALLARRLAFSVTDLLAMQHICSVNKGLWCIWMFCYNLVAIQKVYMYIYIYMLAAMSTCWLIECPPGSWLTNIISKVALWMECPRKMSTSHRVSALFQRDCFIILTLSVWECIAGTEEQSSPMLTLPRTSFQGLACERSVPHLEGISSAQQKTWVSIAKCW